MARRTRWIVDGQEVTAADVRRWCQSVGARWSPDRWPWYVRNYGVLRKIAAELAAGTLDATIADAASRAGVRVRPARQLGTLARLRLAWPQAANSLRWRARGNSG